MITTPEVLRNIMAHGKTAYPEECCGFLLGKTGTDGSIVYGIYNADNLQENHRNRRFLLGPDQYRAASEMAGQRGLDVVGTYHSHPDHPSQPSQTDLDEATFPGFTYVIVSIADGEAEELTAWSLADDRSTFNREAVVTGPTNHSALQAPIPQTI